MSKQNEKPMNAMTIQQIKPLPKDLFVKITILKSMMYCGVLWGLYQQGWAMMREQDEYIFPFWLSHSHATQYAQQHWPNYVPKKITPENFESALMPTLTRLNVKPAILYGNRKPLKLTIGQMRHFFFSAQRLHFAT